METFTTESYVSKQILLKLNNIFYNIPPEMVKFPVSFKVEERDNHLRFITTDVGYMFLGVLGKCITDMMIDHLNDNLSESIKTEIERRAVESFNTVSKQENKECKMCGYPNPIENHFCGLCGVKF